MNAGVEFVRKPVRFICIFLGSGVWSRPEISSIHIIKVESAYGLILVFEEAHCILYNNFVIKADKFHDLFGYPRSNDHQVHFPHINLYMIAEVMNRSDE